ncbi:hypothetical protein BpHYR1_041281 [Brachionus plicatilis]|uniref:Uncharacterized protein n=1 Tax=Brachionus plicatilis TaxID=10195 RepID=A0A3M7PPF9_BRAPC|nr:hypothetical protein BpHYR1_041281 [Brachionus plicatilis]
MRCLQNEESIFAENGAINGQASTAETLDKCYQPGESIRTVKNGHFRVYPYKNFNPEGPLRSQGKYNNDLINSLQRDCFVRGVKGLSVLNDLKYFLPIECTMIDFMHSILEGVVKKLCEYWFYPSFSKESLTLRPYLERINMNLKEFRVPKFVLRLPRDIDDLKYWKANFYKAQILARDFVKDMAYFYGSKSMLSGVHELLHLVRDIQNIGNLKEFSCFPFENANRELLKLIKDIQLAHIYENEFRFFCDRFIDEEEIVSFEQSYQFEIKNKVYDGIVKFIETQLKNESEILELEQSVLTYKEINEIFSIQQCC